MYDDVRQTIRTQIEAGEQLDNKAAAIIRFGSLFLGLFLTGLSIIAKAFPKSFAISWWLLAALGLGGVLLVFAMLFGLLAYRLTTYRYGLRAEDVAGAVDQFVLESEHLEDAIITYAECVYANHASFSKNAWFLNLAFWSFIPGVFLLTSGTAGLIMEVLQ